MKLGASTIQRVSDVEPTLSGQWVASLERLGGPILGPFPYEAKLWKPKSPGSNPNGKKPFCAWGVIAADQPGCFKRPFHREFTTIDSRGDNGCT